MAFRVCLVETILRKMEKWEWKIGRTRLVGKGGREKNGKTRLFSLCPTKIQSSQNRKKIREKRGADGVYHSAHCSHVGPLLSFVFFFFFNFYVNVWSPTDTFFFFWILLNIPLSKRLGFFVCIFTTNLVSFS